MHVAIAIKIITNRKIPNGYVNINLLQNSNSKELYNIYYENIINNKPVILVYGDVKKNIKKLIKKYINIKNEKVVIDKNYNNYLKPSKKVKDIEETSNNHESILFIAYKVKDMTNEDQLYLGIIKNILGYGSNI